MRPRHGAIVARVSVLAAILIGALAIALTLTGAPAFGVEQAPAKVTIRSVDTTNIPTVAVTASVTGISDIAPNDLGVTEGGQPVNGAVVTPIGTADAQLGTVLVLDTDISMRTEDRMDRMKLAAKDFIAAKLPNEQIAIVSAGGPARMVTQFSSDPAVLNDSIDQLAPSGERSLWDGVGLANGLLTDRPELQGNILVLATGQDKASDKSAGAAAASAVAAKAVVHVIGLKGADGISVGDLQSVAATALGTFQAAEDTAALSGAFIRAHQDVANQFVITYRTAAKGAIDLTVRARSAVATASAAPGTLASGANTRPDIVGPSTSPAALRSNNGKWIATGLVVLAAGLLALGLLLVFVRDRADLHAALRPYSDDEPDDAEEYEGGGLALVENALVRRAVETTARIADERGLLDIVEQRLEQAALPLRPAEALFFWVAAVMLGAIAGLVLAGLFGAAVALLLIGLLPVAVLNFMASKRKRKFVSMLPDALQLLASTLRSGYSLMQGVEAVSQEIQEPMGGELRRVLIEARLGRPLEEALQDVADRMGSSDFDWAIMAVRVQREVGGNLAELLDTVGQTMVQRERLRRDVKALTAEGRMSAILLGLLPPGVGFMMFTLNPAYIQNLFTDSLGKTLLIAASVLAIAGFLWMKKMIEIEA